MDVNNLKDAEDLLIIATHDKDIGSKINDKINEWNLKQYEYYNDNLKHIYSKMGDLYKKLHEDLSDEHDEVNSTALQCFVFNKIHDVFMPNIKKALRFEDKFFFDKFQSLCSVSVSADQLGADENYAIRLSAAVVELSMLDSYKSPVEKMNSLCGTYDLVFAELKTAMVLAISKHPDRENEIPVLNNEDVIPLLMVVMIKSRLQYLHSNLFYIRQFYYKLEDDRVTMSILKAFETSMDNLRKVNEDSLKPSTGRMRQSIDLVEFMRLTSDEVTLSNKTLLDEERERVLNLITISTSEDQT